jgi:hypothetical protein
MEKIKKITLQSLDNLSQVLSTKTQKASKIEIEYKILDFISEKGSSMFVEFYNETFLTKNFEGAVKILNI